jgi:hypothetical protein
MDISKILRALRLEHERVNAAILVCERLTKAQASLGASMKRRGRPPGSKNKPKASAPER